MLLGLDYQQFGKKFENTSFNKYPIFDSIDTHIADVSSSRRVNGVHKIFSFGIPIHFEFVSEKVGRVKHFFSVGFDPRIFVANSSNQEYYFSTFYNMKDTNATPKVNVVEEGISKYSIEIPKFNTSLSIAFGGDIRINSRLKCRLEIFTNVLLMSIESEKDGADKVPSYTGSSKDNYINFGINIGLMF